MKVLVTGASGFIGSAVMRALSQTQHQVIGISREQEYKQGNSRVFKFDLLSQSKKINSFLKLHKPNRLIHLAWEVTPGSFWNSPLNPMWREVSQNLVSAFLDEGGQFCLLAGTCAEVAWGEGGYLTSFESDRLNPSSLYGTEKARLLEWLRSSIDNEAWAWGRVFFPYGPGDKLQKFFPTIISNALRGVETKLEKPQFVADYVLTDDLANWIVKTVNEKYPGVINLGSGRAMSLLEIKNLVTQQVKGRSDPSDSEPSSGRSGIVASVDRHKLLGLTLSTPLETGINITLKDIRHRLGL